MYKIYTIDDCRFCQQAKLLLAMKSQQFEEIKCQKAELKAKGYRTAPQVFLDGTLIGGYNELRTSFGW